MIKHPLPGDMDDSYLEFQKAPNMSFGVTMAHGKISARCHERHDLLIYVHNGSARFHVGEKDFWISNGDVLFIPRGAVYSAESRDSRSLELLTVYTPPFDGLDIVYREPVSTLALDSAETAEK
ncbi:MAG: cupin domain-containing protein [Calditrichota bacterium]